MSALEFVASLVSSLAWPVGAVVVVWILRREIRALVGRIRSIDYKGARIEIDRIAEAAQTVEREVLTLGQAIDRTVERTRGTGLMPADVLRDLARTEVSGQMLMQAAVRFLEHTILNAAMDVVEPVPEDPYEQIDALVSAGIVRPDQAIVIRDALKFGQEVLLSGDEDYPSDIARNVVRVVATVMDWIEAGYERHFAAER